MHDPLPIVWRINIKTGAEENVDPRRFCLDRGWLGVGWPVGDAESMEWDAYSSQAKVEYMGHNGWWPAVNAMWNRMSENHLCWTRDTLGIYYLARVTGPGQYVATAEHRAADVVNVRRCEWIRVGPVDTVPGKVIASFRPNRTLQAIDDDTVRLFSSYYYNKHSPSAFRFQMPSVAVPDIFSLMSSEDCEDVVALYMQTHGYLLLPSTCKLAASAYEWVMVHRESGHRAAAQVKNGYDDLRIDEYSRFPGTVYLFTSRGQYVGGPTSNVRCLSSDQVREFMRDYEALLPERIRVWIGIAKELSSHSGGARSNNGIAPDGGHELDTGGVLVRSK